MEKGTGYLFLYSGAAVIVGGAALALASFYGGLAFPQPFDLAGDITVTLSNGATMNIPMPPQINKAANLSIFFLLLFFLLGAGSRLASLGLKMLGKGPAPKDEKIK